MSTAPYDYPPPPSPWSPVPPAPRPAPALDAWSVVSLVAGLLGVTVVGLVAGVVGLARTAGGQRRGRGIAVAGLVVSTLALALQVVLILTAGPALVEGVREGWAEGVRDSTGAPAVVDEATDEDVVMVATDELEVGDCFDDPTGEVFYEIATVPCDVPHDGEVVAEVTLEGTAWPGAEAVDQDGWDACLAAATDAFDAAGVAGEGLDFWTFTPTKESWVLYGDREVSCLAYRVDGRLDAPVLP